MDISQLLTLTLGLALGPTCPVAAAEALPELTGTWQVLVISGVVIRDRDHFTITSRLSNDNGGTWQPLSRTEYQRATP